MVSTHITPQPNERQALAITFLTGGRDPYLPTGEELDQLLADRPSDELNAMIKENFCWLDRFLPSLNSWMKATDIALEARNPNDGDFQFGPNPSFCHHRQALKRLEADVMVAWAPAHHEVSAYSSDWEVQRTGIVELLKRFRLYQKQAYSLFEEAWPGIDLEQAVA